MIDSEYSKAISILSGSGFVIILGKCVLYAYYPTPAKSARKPRFIANNEHAAT